MIRRHGNPTGFWGTASGTREATGIAQASRAVQLGQAVTQFVMYVSVDNATTITLQAAHSGAVDTDGSNPQPPAVTSYQNLYWMDKALTITFAGSGSQAVIVPNFTPGWVRLVSSANVNCIAGWEVSAGS